MDYMNLVSNVQVMTIKNLNQGCQKWSRLSQQDLQQYKRTFLEKPENRNSEFSQISTESAKNSAFDSSIQDDESEIYAKRMKSLQDEGSESEL